jgi:hypothetical protein
VAAKKNANMARWGYKGVKNPNARLTEAQVREIKRRYLDEPGTPYERQIILGDMFGVHRTTIHSIVVTERLWKHVKVDDPVESTDRASPWGNGFATLKSLGKQ